MHINTKTLSEHLKHSLGLELEERQCQLLLSHLDHILSWNEKVNLTSITDREAAMVLHIEDSLAALPLLEQAPAGLLVDLGSGGGFPGVPLCIASGRETMLVEARDKKVAVLDGFVAKANLQACLSVRHTRAEELALETPQGFTAATARALSALPVVAELASPLLALEGVLIAYKGQLSDEELSAARSLEQKLGLSVESVRSFLLSDGTSKRSLVVFRKVAEPEIALPRRVGMAQKRPFA